MRVKCRVILKMFAIANIIVIRLQTHIGETEYYFICEFSFII